MASLQSKPDSQPRRRPRLKPYGKQYKINLHPKLNCHPARSGQHYLIARCVVLMPSVPGMLCFIDFSAYCPTPLTASAFCTTTIRTCSPFFNN